MAANQVYSRRRRWALVLLAFVFQVSFLSFLATTVLAYDLLEADYYTSALADNDAYNRFYTQVLADPRFNDLTSDLVGGTSLGDERSVAVATLRLVLPPATLREITERTIAALIAYLRGDTQRIDTQVDLKETLASLDDVVGQQAANLLATARTEHPESLSAFQDVLRQLSVSLSNGTIPQTLPSLPGDDASEALVDYLFGPQGLLANRRVANQAKAALAAGDSRGALLIMASALVQQPAEAAAARIESRLTNGQFFDPLTALSKVAGRPEVDILAKFNTIRDLAAIFSGTVRWASVLVMALTLLAFAALATRDRPLRWRLAGLMLLVAGIGWTLVWLTAGRLLQTPVTDAMSANGLGTPPPSVGLLVSDIDDSLSSLMTRTLVQTTGAFALAGGIVVLLSFAPLPLLQQTWQRRPPLRRVARIAAMVSLVAAMAFGAWVYSGGLDRGPRECNGLAQLCRKRVNEVVFAGTHNSMAVADAGWLFPHQDAGITQQLNAGVRALLIDTHYWDTHDDVIALTQERVPENVSASLSGFLTTIGEPQTGPLLCHSLCTLGSAPLTDGLGEIKRFLDRNRNEVLVVIIEDYVKPEDTAAAFRQSGLDRYVFTQAPGARWPTLGQMVRSNRRLLVFSENQGPPPLWYGTMTNYIQDTPYDVADAEGFNCKLNRGVPTNQVLLLNNWIDKVSPDRVDAAIANNYDALMKHVRQCQQTRGKTPNIIAVDFYTIGDVARVVEELNRR